MQVVQRKIPYPPAGLYDSRTIPIAKPSIDNEELEAIVNVLTSGQLTQGSTVAEFESAFASYCGASYGVATSSGTTALFAALLAHGIGPGDEVITAPFTFIATANAILLAGAKPVFADIEEDSLNINPDLVKRRITPNTKAILPVHLFGNPCDMVSICALADEHGLVVIEDACQAHGAMYAGQMVGTFGTGCFSFIPPSRSLQPREAWSSPMMNPLQRG